MKVFRALARGAVRSLPRDFRRLFGDEVLRDVEAEPERFAPNLLDILKAGLALHADDFARDVNYAIARLRRAPLFVAAVVVTFALGIGANAAVFSAVNAIVLRPLPFASPDRLVAISSRKPAKWDAGPLSLSDIIDLRAQLHGVTSISGIINDRAEMRIGGGAPKTLRGAAVTSTFFTTLGAVPQIGRLFQPADAHGRHDAVISDRVWRAYFGADPAVIGKRIDLNGTSFAIVGVTLPDAQVPNPHPMAGELEQPDYFTATADTTVPGERGGGVYGVVASLAPGTTISQLNAELLIASRRLQKLYSREDAGTVFSARSLAERLVSPIASALWLVLLAVFGILLIACANVANLIATRWSAREREVAIRRALGASSRRIAVQLFIETGLLAVCGGVTGVALAYVCLRFIPLTMLEPRPRMYDIAIDGTTLLYALLMVCLTTVLAGLAPVLSLGRAELQLVLNSAGRGGGASRGRGLRSALVVAEVALALALVISSGLVVRSYLALAHTPLGIRPDGVYETGPIHLSGIRSPMLRSHLPSRSQMQAQLQSERQAEQRLLARIETQPGIDAAALAVTYPLSGVDLMVYAQLGAKDGSFRPIPDSSLNNITPGYFRALGIPVLRGRAFTSGDSAPGSRLAVVVNQTFVNKFLQGGDGIGERVKFSRDPEKLSVGSIVGVVADERDSLSEPPFPTIFLPSSAAMVSGLSLIVHAPRFDLAAAKKAIRDAVASEFPQIEPPEVFSVSDAVANATQTERSAATLLGALALVPLLLALSGIFAVMSFSVGQRSNEFGVRVAFGARARDILGDVVRRSLITTAIGIAFGIVLAALAARAIAPHITISPFDPLTFGIVIALVVLFAVVAAMVPAVRATRVDPVIALRYE
ncbi:MAG: ADOP family duplicated permease [Candidatus Eremiobacteraeota bacterium]|nr:ADOP family duplicated permease [Candidatus Eremiobacteraeota bacterium]